MQIYVLHANVKKNLRKNKIILLALISCIIGQLFSVLAYKFFDYQINQSIIFGYYYNNTYSIYITLFLLLLIIIFMAINNQISIPFVVLIGATVSNIIDRIIYGGVLDYISVPLIPLFNISDMFIVVASFWILISIVCNKSE